jgi:hypothetical protein
MGEAKRRRERLMREKACISTGNPVAIRRSEVTPRQMLVQIAAQIRDNDSTIAIQVPCGDCQECCWYERVEVDPNKELPEHFAKLDLDHDANGYFLRKRADGACIHLGAGRAGGCTVHAHRPLACRGYDCRLHALAGIVDTFSHNHRSPVWEFPMNHPEDKAIAIALQMGIAPQITAAADGSAKLSCSATRAIEVAVNHLLENLPLARQLVAAVDALPPAEFARFRDLLKIGMKKLIRSSL